MRAGRIDGLKIQSDQYGERNGKSLSIAQPASSLAKSADHTRRKAAGYRSLGAVEVVQPAKVKQLNVQGHWSCVYGDSTP